MFYGEEHKKEFERSLKDGWRSAEGRRSLRESPVFRDLFDSILGWKSSFSRSSYDMPVPIGRYDVFYNSADDFKMCEFNTDGASAMNEENTIGALMLRPRRRVRQETKVDEFGLFDSW